MIEDFDIRIDHAIPDGDWISALCTVRASKNGTGEPVRMSGNVFAKIIDGRIAEAYNHFDFMGLFQQLGLMPDGSFDRCLCGERIA